MDLSAVPLGSRLSLDDFLCFDGPWGIAARTDSKATFMSQLGLNDGRELHRMIFSHMQKEAQRICQELCYDPDALLLELRHSCSIEPPWRNNDIRDDAFRKATLKIYRTASPQTQGLYALVGGEDDNWVTRWMLWHAIDELSTPGAGRGAHTINHTNMSVEQSFPTPDSCAEGYRSCSAGLEDAGDDAGDVDMHEISPELDHQSPRDAYKCGYLDTDMDPLDADAPVFSPASPTSSRPLSRIYWDPCRDL